MSGDARPVRVIATAGHVDHGKSTLVRALTGTDPDRWAEEKARGLTIDLGFASTRLPSGATVAFVDVPGHTRFLKNMLAGVGAVPACVFVVAATEGWKPQSEEHLRILDLLGIAHGLVALTKVAGMGDDDVELARLEVADRVAGTFLEGAEVVPVDAPAGLGIGHLTGALDRLVRATPEAEDRGRPRLWIDRAFAPRGAGTVVTGTLGHGSLAVDDEVLLTPGRRPARVRRLQSLHADVDRIGPGTRVAVNLSGVEHTTVARGDAVVTPGRWHLTTRIDASLTALADLGHPVSRRGAHLLHVGSGEVPVRLRVLGTETIAPGDTGAVRLHLPRALPLVPGDRFVLRDAGRGETVGGGEVLDVEPTLRASVARPDRSVDRVVAERGWVSVDELERLTGERRPADVGRWVVDPTELARSRAAVRDAVAEAGDRGLDLAGLDERRRAVAEALEDTVRDGGRLRSSGSGEAAGARLRAHPWLTALRDRPFEPPGPDGIDPAEVQDLVRAGLVVRAGSVWFATAALDDAAARLAALLADHPDGVTVAQARDALGSSRKYLIPLLTHFDETGRTRRRGDLRIAGPRLDPRR